MLLIAACGIIKLYSILKVLFCQLLDSGKVGPERLKNNMEFSPKLAITIFIQVNNSAAAADYEYNMIIKHVNMCVYVQMKPPDVLLVNGVR